MGRTPQQNGMGQVGDCAILDEILTRGDWAWLVAVANRARFGLG